MPSLSKYERVEAIMCHLHNSKEHNTLTTIAYVTGVPYPSVRATVSYDFPECFTKSDRGSIALSGKFPGDEPFDLAPVAESTQQTVNNKPRMGREHYVAGSKTMKDKLPFDDYTKMQQWVKSSPDEIPKDQYWELYNMFRAGLINMQIMMSPDATKKAKELIMPAK